MMVPTKRIELLASPLPRECSTPELRGLIRFYNLYYYLLYNFLYIKNIIYIENINEKQNIRKAR